MVPYNVPEVRLVDSVPLTATDKVVKRELIKGSTCPAEPPLVSAGVTPTGEEG
jgi:hypothetical protein